MTLYMVGIGLSDEKDISVKGLDIVRSADLIYLENYTSRLQVSADKLSEFYGKDVILADRGLVESHADEIINPANEKSVVFLIVGDVFGATTHTDLFLRAKKEGVDVRVVNNASIINSVGIVGLELYKYGRIASVPYFEKSFKAKTPYDVIKENLISGLHTLVLLDIKSDLDKFMTVNEALKQLLEIEAEEKKGVITLDSMVVGCARIGSTDSVIKYGKIKELIESDFGSPLHCLIIPGKLHFVEEEMLRLWKV